MFDSLKYAKILEEAGLPRNQAETHIRILGDLMRTELATKKDVLAVKQDLSLLIQELRQDTKEELSLVKRDIVIIKENMRRFEDKVALQFQSLEHRMILKLGGLMAAFLATGLTAVKLFIV